MMAEEIFKKSWLGARLGHLILGIKVGTLLSYVYSCDYMSNAVTHIQTRMEKGESMNTDRS